MENEDDSLLCIRYTKAVGEYKDIENNFYSNGSPNDNLESTFWKGYTLSN
jgi:hypothetical protein